MARSKGRHSVEDDGVPVIAGSALLGPAGTCAPVYLARSSGSCSSTTVDPSAPGLAPRRWASPTTETGVLGGHRVPAKRIVAISVWAIHHNPAVWPDHYRFDPDRFSGRQASEGGGGGGGEAARARYPHPPFRGGPRGCIGQYLAMAEMIVAVGTIVRAFEHESLDESPELDVGVSLLPGGRITCRLRRAGARSGAPAL